MRAGGGAPLPASLAVLAVLAGLAVLGAGCGTSRATTTARTAREQLLVSTSAERAIATIDTRRLVGRTVFVDDARLEGAGRVYVASAFADLCAMTGAEVVREAEAADVIVEVRAGAIGTWEGRWVIGVPVLYAAGLAPVASNDWKGDVPRIVEVGYERQEGWARIDWFAYERVGGAYVGGSRGAWGYAHEGLLDDIWPARTLLETAKSRVE